MELVLCMCVMHGVRRLRTVIGVVGVSSMVSRDLNMLTVGDRVLKLNLNIRSLCGTSQSRVGVDGAGL